MPPRFNRILIPLFIVLVFSLGGQIDVSGQAPANTIYLPIVSYNLTGWIGPFGGSIVSAVVDPQNPQVAYVGTFGSGVFKTTDGGNNWFSVNQGLSNLDIFSLAIDPKNPSTVFAGTYHSQVFRTTNGGKSWSWSGMGMQDPAVVYSIAVDPVTPSIVYASTRGASNNNTPPWNGVVYKSGDGGISWSPSLINVGGVTIKDWSYSLVVNPNNHQQVFAAFHENGPYRSNDAGATWRSIHDGVNDPSGRSIIISPQPEFSSRLYYGVWHFDSVYKSLTGGDTWVGANKGIANLDVYSMAIDPFAPDTVYVASYSYGIYKTDNAGAGWIPAGLNADRCYSVVINPQKTYNLFAGTSGDGLYRSMDYSNSWQRSNNGINNAMVTSLDDSQGDQYLLLSSVYGAGVYLSNNRGQTWQELNKGLDDKYVHAVVVDPAHQSILYALTESAGLYQNDLGTANGWVKVGQGLPLTTTYQPSFPADHPFATLDSLESFAYPASNLLTTTEVSAPQLNMVYAPSNPSVAYLGTFGHGVYRSTNGGLTWTFAELGGQTVRSLAVNRLDPNLVYAATDISGSLKYSLDGGYNWKQASLSAEFYSLAASPAVPGVVYAGTNTGIYRYQDGSFTSLGLTDKSVTAIALDSRQPGVIYAGTSAGAYYSANSGDTWAPVDDRLSAQTILSISFDQVIPNVVYFSTKTHGILLVTVQY
jgi:photosystem II stability/assembly factor-like uncharacterized protein